MTLSGTRAALGSPEIDAAFRLNVTAVVSQRQRRRLPAMPDHLPGRPVQRLRRWAAAARGRTWPAPEGVAGSTAAAAATTAAAAEPMQEASSSSSSNGSSERSGAGPEAAATAAVATVDESSAVPFPGQHVYISHDENDSDEYDEADSLLAAAELAPGGLGDAVPAPSSSNGSSSSSDSSHGSSGGGGGDSSSSSSVLPSQQAAADAVGMQQGQAARQPGPRAVLHCRTRVTMAVRVPGPLRVVPNALLGYAGQQGCCLLMCGCCVGWISGQITLPVAMLCHSMCRPDATALTNCMCAPFSLTRCRQPAAAHHPLRHPAQLPGAACSRLPALGRHRRHRRQQCTPAGRSCGRALL